jgi:hypothetical protein
MSKDFKPLGNDWGIQPIGPSPLEKGDMHDTFRVNEQGDISGGHTTVRLPDNKSVKLPWNK